MKLFSALIFASLVSATVAQAETVVYKADAAGTPVVLTLDTQLPAVAQIKSTPSVFDPESQHTIEGRTILTGTVGTASLEVGTNVSKSPLLVEGDAQDSASNAAFSAQFSLDQLNGFRLFFPALFRADVTTAATGAQTVIESASLPAHFDADFTADVAGQLVTGTVHFVRQ